MDKKIYYNELFSFYKDLFTKTQQQYFSLYYEDDLSLSEIADNLNVSRNAVFSNIKTLEKKLDYYEDILKMVSKYKKIGKLIEDSKNIKLINGIDEIIND